jgi:hypothetical protein
MSNTPRDSVATLENGRASGGSDVLLRDHASALTDRRSDEMSLDGVERIPI